MRNFKTVDLVTIALVAAILCILAPVSFSIPFTIIPITLGLFTIVMAGIILGKTKGTICVMIYILLGAVGIPVFAGFSGGIGQLLGNTGGYIIGFLFSALLMWLIEKLFGRKTWVLGISMVLGLIVCYAIGTVWFMVVYAQNSGAVGLATVLGWCVIPFIIPDLVKIALALTLSKRLSKALKLNGQE